jgi:hypothetical protein
VLFRTPVWFFYVISCNSNLSLAPSCRPFSRRIKWWEINCNDMNPCDSQVFKSDDPSATKWYPFCWTLFEHSASSFQITGAWRPSDARPPELEGWGTCDTCLGALRATSEKVQVKLWQMNYLCSQFLSWICSNSNLIFLCLDSGSAAASKKKAAAN